MRIELAKIIDFGVISDPRGDLTFIEGNRNIPFEIKRVYYIYNVPVLTNRGSHAHKNLEQIIIPIAGSFNVKLFDGHKTVDFPLTKPWKSLYIPNGLWREIYNFSEGSISLVLASDYYDESDYIRELSNFKRFTGDNL